MIVSNSEYRQRLHKRDGRYRDYLKETDVPKLLGQRDDKFTPYKPSVSWEEVLHEAWLLCNEFNDPSLTVRDFINSAYINVSATSWQQKITKPTRISKTCREWLATQKKSDQTSEFKVRLIKK